MSETVEIAMIGAAASVVTAVVAQTAALIALWMKQKATEQELRANTAVTVATKQEVVNAVHEVATQVADQKQEVSAGLQVAASSIVQLGKDVASGAEAQDGMTEFMRKRAEADAKRKGIVQ